MAFTMPIIVILFIMAFVMNSTVILGMAIGFLGGSVFICYMLYVSIYYQNWAMDKIY